MVSDHATNIAVVRRADNTVTNVIWGNIYNEDEWITDTQYVVIVDNLAVQIGDIYDGEHFYHNGVQVKSVEETHNDEVAGLMDEIESLCNEIIMGV